MVTAASFIADIDAFLKETGMSPTAFGKAAVNDACFVSDVRSGRMPGLRLVNTVYDFMAAKRVEDSESVQCP